MQEMVIKSQLDLQLWNKLIMTYNKLGFCVAPKNIPLSITNIATEFNITRQKVSTFIKRCKEAEFVIINKRLIYLNPYVVTPYGANDTILHDLQENWNELLESQK